MQVTYVGFAKMSEKKPEDMEFCLIISAREGEPSAAMFGLYNADKKAFFDGAGGYLDEENVDMWTDMRNYHVEA